MRILRHKLVAQRTWTRVPSDATILGVHTEGPDTYVWFLDPETSQESGPLKTKTLYFFARVWTALDDTIQNATFVGFFTHDLETTVQTILVFVSHRPFPSHKETPND